MTLAGVTVYLQTISAGPASACRVVGAALSGMRTRARRSGVDTRWLH